ncbi:MAG: HAMP domain-containing histidine kinase [Firmicutes bacterium]|nr:HAMP domain-containing histidine kinase [Bacillota bacterium]
MKGFLDKTWAKAAAFVLTLVFGVLTVLGSVGVGILISYDVFLDGGDFMRQTMYEGSCVRSIDIADSFLRGTLANAGVLVSDGTYDYSTAENGDVTEEERAQVISDLPRVFAEEFSRDAADCHLTVTVRGNGEVVGTFENFELTNGDKPLYATQETFTYALNTGNTAMVTIAADLLRSENAPSYSYLLCQWLLEHTGLTIFLTALFALLALFCFCFSLAAAGHWQGHEGIHLTWLDKIPADVWLIVLLCTFFIGWEAYYGWGRVFFCAALVPFVLLFLCAFAAQCKAGTVLRASLIARFGRLIWRIVRAVFRALWRIAKSLPLIWKTALAGLILVFIEFVLFMQDYYGTLAAPFLALKFAELLAVLYVAVNLRTLQKGGEKLADGDFSSPIDTKYLIGDFKRYGQELNDVQSGLEQAVQEQMKAEHLKTELITNVSHDIKTPLTSIVNYVDLLKKEDIPSPEAREYIAVLDRQSHRLKKLTEDLVEASKASSGVLNVDLQPTDVNVLFSQIEGEYQERLAACQLTLVTQPPAPGTVIRADSRLLSRVMDNLVSNICKYALPSTRVYVVSTLSREAVTISFKNVSRDELNISPDELMERFVRGDASRHTEGSGLGLSIARSLVQLQGGRFDLAIDADLFRADITFPLSESAAS